MAYGVQEPAPPVAFGSVDTHPDCMSWKLPFGANIDGNATRFRVWGPGAARLTLVIEADGQASRHAMDAEAGGYHHVVVPGAGAGTRYRFAIGDSLVPDPASRSQPDGVDDASEVIDPDAYVWRDAEWRGLDFDALVIYELHVGTFTIGGTFDAAIPHLDGLVDLGVTAVEIMPVASFPGRWNWGYDGVSLFAPSAAYGGPAALQRFVDAAHARGLAVILDVVYNHFGPQGNYLPLLTGGKIFDARHHTVWGNGINYDGDDSPAVREFVKQNALYWAHEYHIDGLRLDATHAIADDSPRHIVAEIARALHALPRPRLVIAEDDRNDRRLVLPADRGGFGLDAVWADDLHHQLRRLAAGDTQGYFRSFSGSIDDVVTTLDRGWFFEGQRSEHHDAPRGTPAGDLPPRAFIHCLQNHDQVGNRPCGDRLHEAVSPAMYRALSALLLLSPYTPLIWMGQEWAASSPFQFFSDFTGDVAAAVSEGRAKEFEDFLKEGASDVPDPQAEATFLRSRLCWAERERSPHRETLALYRELLRLRATEPALRCRDRRRTAITRAGARTIAMRRGSDDGDVIMLLVHLGDDEVRIASDEAALVLPAGTAWRPLLSTEDERFGGRSARSATHAAESSVVLWGPSALVLESVATSV